ncbi:MAG: outer membrane lipid asymmetry maintenance protein MlaD [Magnetococcales bacterium]|nr:outer membrane lipid asymmetry maintenance protein MlaD [Magnetococcales bacterium]
MNNNKLTVMVGLFVVVGIAALAWLSIKLARFELMGGDYYPVQAHFSSIAGLKKGAGVEIAGVEVGRVQHIVLDPHEYTANVTLNIRHDVTVQEDAMASIRTKGLIGDRYIKITPGGSLITLKPGERLIQTEPAINIEELISQFIHGSVNK